MQYPIEHNIPIPSGYSKYPLSSMKVGDSIRVELRYRRGFEAVKSRYLYKNRGTDVKFTTRKLDNLHFRVWRTS